MEKGIHNNIINQVARKVLKPEGLIRKGQSRTWLDDNIWFTTILEFQPSSWSKGTHLNVGINFNWYLNDYISFDYGYRVENFIEYKDDEQFELGVTELTKNGLQKVLEYRNFADFDYAKEKIFSLLPDDGLWQNYHRIMISLITGDLEKLFFFHEKLNNVNFNIKWQKELKENTDDLVLFCRTKTRKEVVDYLVQLIIDTRKMKKFPDIEIDYLRQKLME